MSNAHELTLPEQKRLFSVANLDRQLAWVVVLLPFAGLVAAIVLAMNGLAPTRTSLVLFAVFYVGTMLGIECGYHRLFAHRSFKTVPWMRCLLAILGSMAFQGPVIWWAATHRRHHQCSDTVGDPHSPHVLSGNSEAAQKPGVLRGFVYAHFGWLFWHESTRPAKWASYVKDLYREDGLYLIHMNYFFWLLLGFALPTAIGGLVDGSWQGALLGFLWGGLVRAFFVHHFIWALNSVCHLVGRRPYPGVHDQSRNVFWLALPTFGQGWHNNHHACASSAKVGHAWWQLDVTWMFICLLQKMGLAWDVRTPNTKETVAVESHNPNTKL
jgi:stearoyl-CoA desaturase (delta-9 desaturase)